MENLFLQTLNLSLVGGYAVALVIIARLFLKKLPKSFSYGLWLVVFIRLICPFTMESVLSLIPINPQSVPMDIMYQQIPQIESGILALDTAVNTSLPPAIISNSVNPMQIWIFIATQIWMMGVMVLLLYSIYTYLRLKLRLKSSIHIKENIYEVIGAKTGFVLGFKKPCIYLPSSITSEEQLYIIKHEETHIKRMDHIVKPLAFLVVVLHWFNPVVWLGYFLMAEDMEKSCDEAVIKALGHEIKKSYSTSLLTLATGKKIIGGCPIAFGESGANGRIRNVLNYKKPTFWMGTLAVIAVMVLSVGLFTSPKDTNIIGGDMDIPIDYKASIMVNDTIYWLDSDAEQIALDDGAYIEEKIKKLSPNSQKPVENFEATGFTKEYLGKEILIKTDKTAVYVKNNEGNKYIRFLPQNLDIYSNLNAIAEDLQGKRLHILGSEYDFYIENSKNIGEYLIMNKWEEIVTPPTGDFGNNISIIYNEGITSVNIYPSLNLVSTTYNEDNKWYSITPYISSMIIEYLNSLSSGQKYSISYLTTDLNKSVSYSILNKHSANFYNSSETVGEGHIILDTEEKNGLVYVNILERYVRLGFENNILTDVGGHMTPSTIVFEKDAKGRYVQTDYILPIDGTDHNKDIKEIFTDKAYKAYIEYDNKEDDNLQRQIIEYGKAYLKSIGRETQVIMSVDKIRINMSTDASNYVFEAYGDYPSWIGTKEKIENNIRYIYETSWDNKENLSGIITFKKSIFGGDTVEETIIEINQNEIKALKGTLRDKNFYKYNLAD